MIVLDEFWDKFEHYVIGILRLLDIGLLCRVPEPLFGFKIFVD